MGISHHWPIVRAFLCRPLVHAGSSFEPEVMLVDYEESAALWRAGPMGTIRGHAPGSRS